MISYTDLLRSATNGNVVVATPWNTNDQAAIACATCDATHPRAAQYTNHPNDRIRATFALCVIQELRRRLRNP